VNPFDLRGPEFLGFYAAFAAVVLLATYFIRRALDGAGDPPRLSDPYALAMIRGGREEAVKTALLALHERGAIAVDGRKAVPAEGARLAPGLEAALGERLRAQPAWASAVSDQGVKRALDATEASLRSQGLLPDALTRRRRIALCFAAEFLLVGVAATKIAVALSRGRTNVLFLVLFAALAAFLAWRASSSKTTRKGERLIDDVKRLVLGRASAARRSAHPDPADWAAMVALMAAVGGEAAAPGPFRVKRALWPRPVTSGGSSCGASFSSSSCGGTSSCGSSCGGGCGGGGCGGCGS
jgi:uncharacterized protein (TIGR04222 family)